MLLNHNPMNYITFLYLTPTVVEKCEKTRNEEEHESSPSQAGSVVLSCAKRKHKAKLSSIKSCLFSFSFLLCAGSISPLQNST